MPGATEPIAPPRGRLLSPSLRSRAGRLGLSLLLAGTFALGPAVTDDAAAVELATVDVVVYGATPSGVVAAVAAARAGAQVALVEPTSHIGGMMASGLSWTDRGDIGVIGGIPREVFNRIQAAEGSQQGRYAFQPATVEAVFGAMLAEASVSLHLDERLPEGGGLTMDGPRIVSMTTESGTTFSASQFIDASYEGDLMARAGASYRVGREPVEEHGETLAGVRPSSSIMTVPPEIDPGFPLSAPGPVGSGDARIQAANFRVCLSSDPDNQVPFTAPASYDPATYDIVAEYMAQRVVAGHTPQVNWVLHVDALTNQKWDLNESGPISIGIPGANYDFPEAGYAERQQISDAHRSYDQGFLYFLANDDRVPPLIRTSVAGLGLCADEFTDNGNWPRLLYMREGRRMVGQYVLSQRDLDALRSKIDVIGLASYPMDSHVVSRWIDAQGRLRIEGGVHGSNTSRWAIPYRSLTPSSSEVTNLLVSVTAAASHIANASLRVEPQYMIMGQAAGVAAVMAADAGTTVQLVSVTTLQARLRTAGAVLTDPGDIGASIFYWDILWAFGQGIIMTCGPGKFCPTHLVSRADMADFISRALDLPPARVDYFTDDEGHPSEENINRLAQAEITFGCTATTFCPNSSVTRAEMASFLKRAYDLPPTTRDYFEDDAASVHQGDINRLAESGITAGCTATTFCPNRTITRGEMMAFLRRADGLD